MCHRMAEESVKTGKGIVTSSAERGQAPCRRPNPLKGRAVKGADHHCQEVRSCGRLSLLLRISVRSPRPCEMHALPDVHANSIAGVQSLSWATARSNRWRKPVPVPLYLCAICLETIAI